MEFSEVMDQLKRAGGFSELYHATSFVGTRTDVEGEERDVTIQLLDAGPGVPERYLVYAEDELGRVATGEPAATIEAAIAQTHWHELDEEPEEDEDD